MGESRKSDEPFVCRGQCAAAACPLDVCLRTGRARRVADARPMCIERLAKLVSGNILGAAIDVGTTTIEMQLVNLETGRAVAYGALRNLQGRFGSDVISRIEYTRHSEQGTGILHDIVCIQISTLLDACLDAVGAGRDMVQECVVTGNTTMLHLAAGITPASMGAYPFTPLSLFGCDMPPAAVDLPESCELYFAPCASAFVGADVICGAVALQSEGAPNKSMLVDLGTNGEIIAWNKETVIASATAAGPVFEGGSISCGTPAAAGAVTRVAAVGDKIRLETIDSAPPCGLCGAGIIDAVAVARRTGALESTGSLQFLGPFVTYMLDETPAFALTDHLMLSQKDIREIQAAKAAVRAGIQTILSRLLPEGDSLNAMYLAGGLGTAVDPVNAAAIGLVPPEPEPLPAGNAALRGAQCLLMDYPARKRAVKLAQTTQVLDLALEPEFQQHFIDYMEFKGG